MKNFVKALWVVIAGLFITSCSELSENSTKISFMVPELSRAEESDSGTCTFTVTGQQNGFKFSATKNSGELFETEVEPDVLYEISVTLVFTNGDKYSGTTSIFAKAGKENTAEVTVKKVSSDTQTDSGDNSGEDEKSGDDNTSGDEDKDSGNTDSGNSDGGNTKPDSGSDTPAETAVLKSISAIYSGSCEVNGTADSLKFVITENYSDSTSKTGSVADYEIDALPASSIGNVPVNVVSKKDSSIKAVVYIPVYYNFAENLSLTAVGAESYSLTRYSSGSTVKMSVSFGLSDLKLYAKADGASENYNPSDKITYQWYKDGKAVSGKTDSEITFDTSVVGSSVYTMTASIDDEWVYGDKFVTSSEIAVVITETATDITSQLGSADCAITTTSEINGQISYSIPATYSISSSETQTIMISKISSSAISVGSEVTLNVSSTNGTLYFDAKENSYNTAVFSVADSGVLTFDNVVIRNNTNNNSGSVICISNSGILNIKKLTMSNNTSSIQDNGNTVKTGDIQLAEGTVNLNGYYSGSIYYDNGENNKSTSKTINVSSDFDTSSVIEIVLNQSVTSGTQILTSTSGLSDAQLACFTVRDLNGDTYSLDSSGKVVIVTGSVSITYPSYSAGTLSLTAAESGDNIGFTTSGASIGPVSYQWLINSVVCENVTTGSATFAKSQFAAGINTVTVIATDGTKYENASVYVTITK